MSSESTPSSSLAPANLSSTITSSFFSILQNRNIIHIVCEVVIISITSYYFYKKTNTLSNQIKILEAKIEQLENEQLGLNQALADGSLYASDPKSAADKATRVGQIDDELLAAMERLELLSQRTSLA